MFGICLHPQHDRGDKGRTCRLLVPNQASHSETTPRKINEKNRTCTCDLQLNMLALCYLIYFPKKTPPIGFAPTTFG